MITVLSATNRKPSTSEIISQAYTDILRSKGVEVQFFSFSELTADFFFPEMYDRIGESLQKLVDTYIAPAEKIVFVIPEYNGSYPGILKTFIDAAHPRHFREKKAGIIGISDGHAGNIRGLEHLTGILIHMKMLVHYMQPKLSAIDKMIDAEGKIVDERTLKLLHEHAEKMVGF